MTTVVDKIKEVPLEKDCYLVTGKKEEVEVHWCVKGGLVVRGKKDADYTEFPDIRIKGTDADWKGRLLYSEMKNK